MEYAYKGVCVILASEIYVYLCWFIELVVDFNFNSDNQCWVTEFPLMQNLQL